MSAIDNTWRMPPNKEKALMLAQREIATFVCDAVNLEGIPFTLPEIQILLDGVAVDGYKLADQQIAINQGNAWNHLFASLPSGSFSLSAEYACALHNIAAKKEVLAWGVFRTGGVTIAGTPWIPTAHDKLPALFANMIEEAQNIPDIYDRAR